MQCRECSGTWSGAISVVLRRCRWVAILDRSWRMHGRCRDSFEYLRRWLLFFLRISVISRWLLCRIAEHRAERTKLSKNHRKQGSFWRLTPREDPYSLGQRKCQNNRDRCLVLRFEKSYWKIISQNLRSLSNERQRTRSKIEKITRVADPTKESNHNKHTG